MEDTKKKKTPEEIKKEIEDREASLRGLALAELPPDALALVKEVKAQGIAPIFTQIGPDNFIYRTIKRSEWKDLLEKQADMLEKLSEKAENQTLAGINAELRSEEDIVIRMTLWPKIDQLSIKSFDAGQIETLAAQIKNSSGFNQQSIAIRL